MIKWNVTPHLRAEIGDMICEEYGEHMVSLDITEDTENGLFAKVGKMKSLDLYDFELANTKTENNVTTGAISAYIVMQSPINGLWLVILDDVSEYNDHLAFIYQKPLIAEESPYKLTKEENFYNDPKDGPVRGHICHALDRVWLSAGHFIGTPAENATISAIQDGRLVID